MKELENIQDRIDEYIRGTMSDKDKAIFEEELRQDAELRHEVEVQATISDAVQAVHLKQVLKGVEAELSTPKVYWRRVYQWASVAAAVAIILIAGNIWRQSSRIKAFGNDYYASLEAPYSRGGNNLDSLLTLSYTTIGEGQYAEAEDALKKAELVIHEGMAAPVVDDETEYERKVLELKQYDVEWYQAIIVMKQGKYRHAKTILKEIVASGSPYADEAKEILNKMYNDKL